MKPARALGAALAAIVAALTVAVSPSPAQAFLLCPTGVICMTDGYNSTGTRIAWHDPYDRPGCFNVLDNRIASIDNITTAPDHNIRVYNGSSTCWSGATNTLFYASTEGNMAGIWYKTIDSFYLY